MNKDSWKEKNKEQLRLYQIEWRKKNKARYHELNKKSRLKRLSECPWLRYRHSTLCNSRKIKCELTIDDVKQAWFRDRAFEMKKPSVDRINPSSHYHKKNIRFLELSENASLSTKRRKRDKKGRLT